MHEGHGEQGTSGERSQNPLDRRGLRKARVQQLVQTSGRVRIRNPGGRRNPGLQQTGRRIQTPDSLELGIVPTHTGRGPTTVFHHSLFRSTKHQQSDSAASPRAVSSHVLLGEI